MKIIGISGVAGAGKDFLFENLNKKIKCKRFSLGDELKKEIRPYCLQSFDIDPTICSREEKNLIRPCLVSHALIRRKTTEGRYWIEKTDRHIKNHIFEQVKTGNMSEYSCITDIRYNQYEKDEVYWLKKELNGILIHVSQFTIAANKKRIFVPPANEEEASQNESLKREADYVIECEKFTGSPEKIQNLYYQMVIKPFLKFIKK